jgi:hypothetical protein
MLRDLAWSPEPNLVYGFLLLIAGILIIWAVTSMVSYLIDRRKKK